MAEALKSIRPDFIADDMTDLRYVHRKTADADIYWVNNRRNTARQINATFRVSGLKPMLWHPETGKAEEVSYEMHDDVTIVRLNLAIDDAVFVVFDEKTDVRKVELPTQQEVLFRHVDTPWTVQFDEAWGGPKETTFDPLISYTESSDEGIRYYSGTAIYRNTLVISAPELKQGRFVLNLGEVGCMAEVIVNGKNLGILWKRPYTVDVTDALTAGENTLEIHVINQWTNRIIGDLQPNCSKRYTFPAFNYFYRPDSPLLPAGLMGPVNLMLIPN